MRMTRNRCWTTLLLAIAATMSMVVIPAHGQEDYSVVLCKASDDYEVDPRTVSFVRAAEDMFCINGGTCKRNYEATPEYPCDCPRGTAGPHCEFESIDEAPACDLRCHNGGRCEVGIRSHLELSKLPEDYHYNYCICPPNFYGKQCGIEGKQCGSTTCLNGGGCVQIENPENGTVTDHCDCSMAEKDGKKFAGRFCQSEHTSMCSDRDSFEATNFCTNGGVCNIEPWEGCECPEGYYGALCEFHQVDDGGWQCNLDCGTHGFCRKGVKDTSFIDNFDFNDRRLTQRFTQDFEYCTCEPGWVGLACDIEMDVCPGQTTICLNGASCVYTEETGEMGCDCSTAKGEDTIYTGKYCQYEATSYCTVDGKEPEGDGDAFCANGGICVGYVSNEEPHPGCFCDAGYTGAHCETMTRPPDDEPDNEEQEDGDANTGMLLFALVAGTIGASLVAIFLILYVRKRRSQYQHAYKQSVVNEDSSEIGTYTDTYADTKSQSQYGIRDTHQKLSENEALRTGTASDNRGRSSISQDLRKQGSNSGSFNSNKRSPLGSLGDGSNEDLVLFESSDSGQDSYRVRKSETFDSDFKGIKSDYSVGSYGQHQPPPQQSSIRSQQAGNFKTAPPSPNPSVISSGIQSMSSLESPGGFDRSFEHSEHDGSSMRSTGSPQNLVSDYSLDGMASLGDGSRKNNSYLLSPDFQRGPGATGSVLSASPKSLQNYPEDVAGGVDSRNVSFASRKSVSKGEEEGDSRRGMTQLNGVDNTVADSVAATDRTKEETSSDFKAATATAKSVSYDPKAVAERSAHYSTIGSPPATTSPKRPWREEKQASSKSKSSSKAKSSPKASAESSTKRPVSTVEASPKTSSSSKTKRSGNSKGTANDRLGFVLAPIPADNSSKGSNASSLSSSGSDADAEASSRKEGAVMSDGVDSI